MEELLSQIAGDWFLTEPLMFSVWCTHTLEVNSKMCVPMRTGKMRIDYILSEEMLQIRTVGKR